MAGEAQSAAQALDGALCVGYQPPGPVAKQFIFDTVHRLQGIMGPFGSGKTSCCPIKATLITRLQPPMKHDGVRRSQVFVIRNTYRELVKTIESWLDVYPVTRDWPMEGPTGGPQTHTIRERDIVNGREAYLETKVFFRALSDQNVEEFTRGLRATAIWLNEADTLPEDAVGALIGRLGRFPPPHMVADTVEPGFGCVMCDFNAPNWTNWTYRKFFLEPGAGAKVYVQPSGLAENAENPVLRKLNPNYYQDLMSEMDDWQIARFIENKIGYSRFGQPVYTEFDFERHVAA